MPTASGPAPTPRLILASSSPYRRELLKRLQLRFDVHPANIDESAQPGEEPAALAGRLAGEKARAISAQYPRAVVIGSDQVVECAGASLGKPGSAVRAVEQLEDLQGRSVTFHTAIHVTDGVRELGCTVPTVVRMRTLTRAQIERYVEREQALDCAGAFKSEALGICLIERLHSDDPTALVGLPLIATVDLLEAFGIALP